MTDQSPAPGCAHRELATGWALHALEPAEEILVAAHLPDCSECTRTVAEAELIGAALGLSVPEAIPSPGLEQRVLAGTVPESPVISPPPSVRPAPQAFQLTRRPPVSRPRRPPPRRRGRPPICVPETLVMVGIALLVFVLAFVIVLYLIP